MARITTQLETRTAGRDVTGSRTPPPAFFRCVLPTDLKTEAVIQHLREQGLIGADHRLRRGTRDIVVLTTSEIGLLEQCGITCEVLRELPGDAPRIDGRGGADAIATGFVSTYLDSAGIDAGYAALHALFPTLTTLSDLPEPTAGYDGGVAGLAGPSPVKLFRITTTPAVVAKPALLVVAGLHAREWAPPLAALEFASQLLHNYDPVATDPDVLAINALVENLDILIVGAGNPDGIDFSRHDHALWRKNRRPNGPGCSGVDNNRNFSVYWGEGGSSGDPCDFQIYRGPSAFSEPENRNLRWIVETFPNVLAAIDCHSFGEDFLRPQPDGGTFIGSEPVPPGDDAIYTALETSMNDAVGTVSPGKSYATGTTSNHAGTFDEYMYFGHRIFAFELEIGDDFQPPIADALVSVGEAAAVMRALAGETLNLGARFVTPAAIVQAVDCSGSMVASGYVESTRRNAQRLVDLMSINDSTAIVSFNAAAATELPLTAIVDAGGYAAAYAAVAGIGFGGATSIGGGLQRASTLLPGPGQPRSIVLLSDGYENSAPTVSAVLPALPADVRVHTVALGFASDQALLQQLALQTGGTYFFSPDELGLFEIYDVAHAALADHDLILATTLSMPGRGDAASEQRLSRRFVVDCDADYVDVSVAAHRPEVRLDVDLRCLSVPFADLSRLVTRHRPGYSVLRLKRPQPGWYEVVITAQAAGPVTCSLAAFVKSPLRFKWIEVQRRFSRGDVVDLPFAVMDHGHAVEKLSIVADALCPATSVDLLARRWQEHMRPSDRDSHDAAPQEIARAEAVREHLRRTTGRDPASPIRKSVHLVYPRKYKFAGAMAVRIPTLDTIDGTYNVRVTAQGRTRTGCEFARVGFRSVRIA